jgi:hypothetical protein
MVIRRGRTSRFIGPAFRAAERADLDRLARVTGMGTGTAVRDADAPGGGKAVALLDPSGIPVRVGHCAERLPELPGQRPLLLNAGTDHRRVNDTHWTGTWTRGCGAGNERRLPSLLCCRRDDEKRSCLRTYLARQSEAALCERS